MLKQIRFFCLLLLIISFNITIGGKAVILKSNPVDLPEFFFTGSNSIENYDFNADGYGDILIFRFELNVSKTGLIQFGGLCSPTILFWNDSDQLNDNYFNYCLDSSGAIINLGQIGLMNLSVWYGYGSIFSSLLSSEYDYMQKANITMRYNLFPIFSDLSGLSNKIMSPEYVVTMSDVHSLSLGINSFGIRDTMLSNGMNLFTNERSESDVYKWKINQYYKDPPTTDLNINGTLETSFAQFDSHYINMTQITTYDNGTLRDKSNFDILPEKRLSSASGSFIQYIISKNFNTSTLKVIYTVIWNSILNSYKNQGIIIENSSLLFNLSSDYFGFQFHFDYQKSDSVIISNNSLSFDMIFHLPTGLLSYFRILALSDSTIQSQLKVLLIEPNYGITTIPKNTTVTSASSSSILNTNTNTLTNSYSSSEIITTIGIDNPLLIFSPILSYLAIKHFKKRS